MTIKNKPQNEETLVQEETTEQPESRKRKAQDEADTPEGVKKPAKKGKNKDKEKEKSTSKDKDAAVSSEDSSSESENESENEAQGEGEKGKKKKKATKKKSTKKGKKSKEGEDTGGVAQPADAPPPLVSDQNTSTPNASARSRSAKAPKQSPSDRWKRKFGDEIVEKKRGRWSDADNKKLMDTIKAWVEKRNVSLDDVRDAVQRESALKTKKEFKHLRGIWVQVAQSFPERTVDSVMQRGYRLLHPGLNRPKTKHFLTEEEKDKLIGLVETHGRRWNKIASIMNRFPTYCRDLYDRLMEVQVRKSGPWTPQEEQQLYELVKQHHDDASDPLPKVHIPWRQISATMNRPIKACITKWTEQLHPRYYGVTGKHWTKEHDLRLVKAIKDSGAQDESEVPWSSLLLQCTQPFAKRKWKSIVRGVPPSLHYSFDAVVQYALEMLSGTGDEEKEGESAQAAENENTSDTPEQPAAAAATAASSSSSNPGDAERTLTVVVDDIQPPTIEGKTNDIGNNEEEKADAPLPPPIAEL